MTRYNWFAALALGFLASTSLAAQSVDLAGTVLTDTRQPLSGASIELTIPDGGARSLTTDAFGRFVATNLPAGALRLKVTAPGFRATSRVFQVTAQSRNGIEIVLAAAPIELAEVEVVSLRTSVPLSTEPGAVTVIGTKQLEQQAQLSSNVGDILGQVVPGLGTGMQSVSVFGQSLRGRNVAVLIDGVPQSTTRNVSRDLATIDPAAIERVEVLRGATSIFGDGATGGVINIITKRPAVGGPRFSTTVFAESAPDAWREGLGGRITQAASGVSGAFDFTASATLGRIGEYYDGEGDLIPSDPHGQGGLAETDTRDVFGKVGYSAGDRRVEFSGNFFASEQATGYVSDPATKQFPAGTVKAMPLAGLQLAEDQGTRNAILNVAFSDADLFGQRMHAQVYHRDYRSVFTPFDGRALAGYRAIIQSWLDSRKTGARLELERALPFADAALVWGADYTHESTSQPVHTFDAETYDASGGLVFEKTGERPWVPEIKPQSLGLFAQLSLNPFDRLALRGGIRHERARMDVPDFITLTDAQVIGGELRFEPTLLNIGAVFTATQMFSLYGSYSQGFSLADVGLALRGASAGAVLGNKEMEAQEVDQYEVGIRAQGRAWNATLAAFRSESELGTTSAGFGQPVVRAPERVYGLEVTLEVAPVERLTLGGTVGWNEGEYFLQRDSTWYPLNGWRIQPLKVTAYTAHQTLPSWSNRVQLLYSGARDRAFEERPNTAVIGFGERTVASYLVADWISELQLGPGTITLAAQNLFDRQYFTVVSQLMRTGNNTSYTAARGRTLSVGYTVRY